MLLIRSREKERKRQIDEGGWGEGYMGRDMIGPLKDTPKELPRFSFPQIYFIFIFIHPTLSNFSSRNRRICE